MKRQLANLGQIILITSILALSNGCEKETVGPAGPSTIIATDSFYVAQSDWVNTTGNFWTYTYTNNKITQEVVSKGVINISSWYPADKYWIAWPFYSGWNGGSYHYFYKKDTIVLQVDNMTPPATSFKVVIMK